jgi:hypothetical protein
MWTLNFNTIQSVIAQIVKSKYTRYYTGFILLGLVFSVVIRLTVQNNENSALSRIANMSEKMTGYLISPFYICYKFIKWMVTDGIRLGLRKLSYMIEWLWLKFWNIIEWISIKLWNIIEWLWLKFWNIIEWISIKLWNIIEWISIKIFLPMFKKIFNLIKKTFKLIWNVIKKIVYLIEDIVNRVLKAITTSFRNIWYWCCYAWYWTKNFYFTYIYSVITSIIKLVQHIIYNIYETLTMYYNDIYEILTTICNNIYETLTTICNNIYETLTTICNNIYETTFSVLNNITSSHNADQCTNNYEVISKDNFSNITNN